jgi:hypothetical protein
MKSDLQSRSSCDAQQLRCDVFPRQEALLPGNRIMRCDETMPRLGLVARVRAQIAAGTYDIDGKFDEALDRLFESLARG